MPRMLLRSVVLIATLGAPATLGATTTLGAEQSGEPTIQFLSDPQRVVVDRLSTEQAAQLRQETPSTLQRYFRLQVAAATPELKVSARTPPVFGSYQLEKDQLHFVPRYPLEAGMTYYAEFRLPGGPKLERKIVLPAADHVPSATVKAVYPSSDVLPENQLKFYLHFSEPMSRGEAYERVHLFEVGGDEVERPFLELEQELWDTEGTRFTLYFDPGRIKRGLRPHDELGPALEADRMYRFVIDRDWLDAKGQPLRQPFEKRFRVAGPDELQPDPHRWQLRVPERGSQQALIIRFDEPLDHAMLLRVTSVQKLSGAKKESVQVTRFVGEGERSLRLLPSESWQPGDYRFAVRTDLEDLAGNSIAQPFEIDRFEKVDRRVTARFFELPFRIEE